MAAAGVFVGRVGSKSWMMKPECLNYPIDKLEDTEGLTTVSHRRDILHVEAVTEVVKTL